MSNGIRIPLADAIANCKIIENLLPSRYRDKSIPLNFFAFLLTGLLCNAHITAPMEVGIRIG
jgi:hypothetical protein